MGNAGFAGIVANAIAETETPMAVVSISPSECIAAIRSVSVDCRATRVVGLVASGEPTDSVPRARDFLQKSFPNVQTLIFIIEGRYSARWSETERTGLAMGKAFADACNAARDDARVIFVFSPYANCRPSCSAKGCLDMLRPRAINLLQLSAKPDSNRLNFVCPRTVNETDQLPRSAAVQEDSRGVGAVHSESRGQSERVARATASLLRSEIGHLKEDVLLVD